MTAKRAPNAALSYEAAIEKLESIVTQIESGEIGLEESLLLYEEGTALAARCKEILSAAEQRVEHLSKRASETPPTPQRPNSGPQSADKDGPGKVLADDAPLEPDEDAPF